MTYTAHYVGTGGNDANSGSTWALRKLTLNGVEDTPLTAARHIVYVAPGTYREMLTCDLSGPTAYATGTVSVTKGSKIVTGSGTLWAANAEANDWFQCPVLASGTDGVTDGSSTFVSAAGNFQANMVGLTIRISTKAAAIIATVVDSDTITLADTAGVAVTPSAASGLTYNVGPSSPHKVASVDSDTQITLVDAWDDPTLTTLAYKVWGHIEYIGDYLGTNTGGIGGVVRITGSDNDQTATRNNAIVAGGIRNYRTFTGFLIDTSTAGALITANGNACTNWTIQQCIFMSASVNSCITINSTSSSWTIQNCVFWGANAIVLNITHTSVVDNSGHLISNCIFLTGPTGIGSTRVGGFTVKNCMFMTRNGLAVVTAITVGQTITVNNCIFVSENVALSGTVSGEIIENYNNFFGNATNRTNTTTGGNSLTYPPLFDTRWFFLLCWGGAYPSTRQLVSPFDLASYSQLLNVAGTSPSTTDLRGTTVQGAQREWGALEYDSSLKSRGGVRYPDGVFG